MRRAARAAFFSSGVTRFEPSLLRCFYTNDPSVIRGKAVRIPTRSRAP
ncbi:hypothetical protein MYA_0023 [Burkholderia sp. KJ006]|nr:hypothetical protein MYA_0023 [Burkholderia sp. KJ006]